MEVTLKINTEKEDINELKKLQKWVSELIEKRESAVNTRIEEQKKEEAVKLQEKKEEARETPLLKPSFQTVQEPKREYSGSGKIIDYEDMSDMMSKVYSGGRL